MDALKERPLRWHMIGHLQRNKVKQIAEHISMVETLDSVRLARELNKVAQKLRRQIPVLIQVSLAEEEQKSGVVPEDVESLLTAVREYSSIQVRGFMTMPPWDPDPERGRPIFRRLRQLRDDMEERLDSAFPELSMGMSNDYEIAIQEGSNMIRIGTAIFGERKY